jgi:HD-GYP domain-containing protein (c-di-GMP phosphodiesterase class II)
MARQSIKTDVGQLEEGMFVAQLDRPWSQTPFPLQGFYINSQDDINALKPYCKYVYVDALKSHAQSAAVAHSPGGKKSASRSQADSETSQSAKRGKTSSGEKVFELPPITIKAPETYKTVAPLHKEAARAKRFHKQVHEAVHQVCQNVLGGQEVKKEDLEGLAVSMVVSVTRNPDALVWLSKMDDTDQHGYQHVVKTCIWALVFARHLGLSKTLMKSLAIGVLLSQVGMVKIDPSLRNDPASLSGKERAEFERFVEKGVEIVRDIDGLSDGVISVVQYHRERHNGSGFPKGMTGDRIPLLAKIAGLVDAYQDMITPRGEDLGLSPREAVSRLYDLRNIQFQKDLVERFIQAIGVYPTGTLVELNTREVGIVTGHNEERRLLPRLIIVTDANKQHLKNGKRIDLVEWNSKRSASEQLFIKDSLPKGAYDINENAYLLSGATSKWSLKHLTTSLS